MAGLVSSKVATLPYFSRWTAKEHAALRGLLKIAELFDELESGSHRLSDSVTNSWLVSQVNSLNGMTAATQVQTSLPSPPTEKITKPAPEPLDKAPRRTKSMASCAKPYDLFHICSYDMSFHS